MYPFLSNILFLVGYHFMCDQKVDSIREFRLDIQNERRNPHKNVNSKRSLKNLPGSSNVSRRVTSKSRRWSENYDQEVLQINGKSLSALTADGEVIGIITMEDVIEELLNVCRHFLFLSICLLKNLKPPIVLFFSQCRRKFMMRLIAVTTIHS